LRRNSTDGAYFMSSNNEGGAAMAFDLNINGRAMSVDVEGDMPLLWVLRDELKMTGTKFGCGLALCGACTVHADGQPIRSCQTTVADAAQMKIVTIEGLEGKASDAIRAAWRELDVPQCGYCQSGQIMAASALLSENAAPSDDDINAAMDGNVCRCATYHRIRAGIHRAAEIMKG
jgi:isoquinoline 1-oxidoreductase alpha subunit